MHQKRNTIIKSVIKNIKDNIISALEPYNIEITLDDFNLSPPKQESFGDLSSNIALLISKQMKDRLAKLDRDVQFLRLELDKLKSKKDQTPDEKAKINELELKINTRRKTFFLN